jgi:predicted metal-dependent peptidase
VNATRKVIAARTQLVIEEPFWAPLAMRLQPVEDTGCRDTWTDGQTFGFNPKYIDSLPVREVVALIAKATAQCALGHPWRREERNQGRWNKASSLTIGNILADAKFFLPAGMPVDPQYSGMSCEACYSKLPMPDDSGGGGEGAGGDSDGPSGADGQSDAQGDGGGQGEDGQAGAQDSDGGPGEVRDAPADAEGESGEDDWSQAAAQAAMGAGRGHVPAGLARAVTEAANPRCKNLTEAVLEWAGRMSRDDYSWSRPNTRYMPMGFYLPALFSPAVGTIACGIDTSGSIDDVSLSHFSHALQEMLDGVNPEKLTVYGCDTLIHTVHEYTPGDSVSEHYKGRGGTDFRPVFDATARQDEPPIGMVFLTDLDGPFPAQDPGYPVLWVCRDTMAMRRRAPFGEIVYIG